MLTIMLLWCNDPLVRFTRTRCNGFGFGLRLYRTPLCGIVSTFETFTGVVAMPGRRVSVGWGEGGTAAVSSGGRVHHALGGVWDSKSSRNDRWSFHRRTLPAAGPEKSTICSTACPNPGMSP